jgi:hypothetical protein
MELVAGGRGCYSDASGARQVHPRSHSSEAARARLPPTRGRRTSVGGRRILDWTIAGLPSSIGSIGRNTSVDRRFDPDLRLQVRPAEMFVVGDRWTACKIEHGTGSVFVRAVFTESPGQVAHGQR